MNYKLGKCAAKHDPKSPRMSALPFMTRTAPARLLRDHIDPSPLMLGNDTLGDCTSVGIANALRAQCSLGGFQVAVETSDAIRFYSASTGYQPSNASTDLGGVEVDVLAYAARKGYALQSEQVPSFPLWGTMDREDLNGVRLCMAGLGVAYGGFLLAQADQYAETWDTTTPGDQTPGSWGGHCALLWDYTGTQDDDLVTVLTWGMKKKATWRWVRSRMDEAHAITFPQFVPPNGLLGGADWDALKQENAQYLTGV